MHYADLTGQQIPLKIVIFSSSIGQLIRENNYMMMIEETWCQADGPLFYRKLTVGAIEPSWSTRTHTIFSHCVNSTCLEPNHHHEFIIGKIFFQQIWH